MKQLFICWLLLATGFLCYSPAFAQHRLGQARYHRSAAYHDYYRPGHRTYHYWPSRRAYFNRQAYQPRVYHHQRPIARRPPMALLQPRQAKFR